MISFDFIYEILVPALKCSTKPIVETHYILLILHTREEAHDCFVCPKGQQFRHTTTSKDGRRTYRSTPKLCQYCPCRQVCGANEKGQRLLTTHIWQEHLDLAEQLRKTQRGKEIYSLRKQTIERVFSDAKEKHGLRYTHHRGLARVISWVRLKFAAMNLKKFALWLANSLDFSCLSLRSFLNIFNSYFLSASFISFFDRLKNPRILNEYEDFSCNKRLKSIF